MTDHLERVRNLLSSLPNVIEKTAWGAPTFRTAGRMFGAYNENHHSDGRIAVWLLCDIGHREALMCQLGDAAFIPPYWGVSGWIGIELTKVDDETLMERLEEAHAMCTAMAVKPKRKPRQPQT